VKPQVGCAQISLRFRVISVAFCKITEGFESTNIVLGTEEGPPPRQAKVSTGG